jgi:MarR family transcriptional regulator, lower aerobic nicotinate degradation pathway regulator
MARAGRRLNGGLARPRKSFYGQSRSLHDEDALTNAESSAIHGMPGHLLRRCNQIAVAIFLDECRGADLTPLQFVTLATLAAQGALDKATIGREVALDRTTVAVVVKNLEERGLVTSRDNTEDRRARLIEITPEGRALAQAVKGDVQRTQERILSPLAPDEQAELVRLLAKMAEVNNLESRAPQQPRRAARK